MPLELGAQHEGVVHTQAQEQEVEVVVEVAVGHPEEAHEAKCAANRQPHNDHGHKGQEHAGVDGVALPDHDGAVEDDDAVRSRELGDVTTDCVAELVTKRALEQAAELQQVILWAVQLGRRPCVGIHAHEAQGTPLPLVGDRVAHAGRGTVELGLVQREES